MHAQMAGPFRVKGAFHQHELKPVADSPAVQTVFRSISHLHQTLEVACIPLHLLLLSSEQLPQHGDIVQVLLFNLFTNLSG
jgi:hypothetical protein